MIDAPRRLNVDDLHKWVSIMPDDMRNADGERAIFLANSVIVHFLGPEWFAAHIRHDNPKPGFLRIDFSSDRRREATVFRVVELAESLFNLQNIDGFDACIMQMKGGGDKIQSTCAELDFGRFLYMHDVEFRFVVPQMKKGSDYDVELFYPDGLVVPADAKCKLETTEINPQSIVNSLDKARKQLPGTYLIDLIDPPRRVGTKHRHLPRDRSPDVSRSELCQPAKDGQHQPPVRGRGVGSCVAKGLKPGLLRGNVLNRVEKIAG